MKINLFKGLSKASAIAAGSFIILVSIPSVANAATLNTQSNQAENKQLIAQSCGNTEIRLINGQSQSWGRGSRWQTCNGYTFVLQNDGNLVLYSRTAWLWSANTAGRGHAIALQRDGNVVLYDINWKPIWATNTVGNSGAFLALQTDGNLVVYNSSGRPLWATNTVQPVQSPFKLDPRSETNIASLKREVQPSARALFEKAAKNGIQIQIIAGTRSYAEQDALYCQGRNIPYCTQKGLFKNGAIVTNAKAGESNHNFGIAFDIGIFDGKKYLPESSKYNDVGKLGKELGLEWGGDWSSFRDRPHFQLRPKWASNLTEPDMLKELRRRAANNESFSLNK
jgi:peptidoglycan LD-endopeptidase CwlK